MTDQTTSAAVDLPVATVLLHSGLAGFVGALIAGTAIGLATGLTLASSLSGATLAGLAFAAAAVIGSRVLRGTIPDAFTLAARILLAQILRMVALIGLTFIIQLSTTVAPAPLWLGLLGAWVAGAFVELRDVSRLLTGAGTTHAHAATAMTELPR